jgi:non-homologous end joining protein Ku
VDRAECGKGVEVSKDTYKVLSPDAVEAIQSAERTDTLEAQRFPLAETELHRQKSIQ